jgi:HD-like signal output (HDOD) protein/ActR/RegA family two-component response regulator
MNPRAVFITHDTELISLLETTLPDFGVEVLTGTDAKSGITHVYQSSPDIVFVDERVQGMAPLSIVKGLRQVEQAKDKPVVFMIDRPTKSLVIRAVEAGATSVLIKPFVRAELVERIRMFLDEEMAELVRFVGKQQATIPDPEEFLPEVAELMAVPFVVERVLTLTGSEDSGAEDLEKVILTDPSTTAAILRRANSAMYGGVRKISQLIDAITRIGFRQVRTLVLGLKMVEMFHKDRKSLGLDRLKFWKHSVGVAMMARMLCRRAGLRKLEEDAFICGLLHDLGKIILDEHFPQGYEKALDVMVTERLSLEDAERAIFQIDSEKVAESILTSWNFPGVLVDVIGCHRNLASIYASLEGQSKDLAEVIWTAKSLVMTMQIGASGDRVLSDIPKELIERFDLAEGISEDDEQKLMVEYNEMVKFLGVEAGKTGHLKEDVERDDSFGALFVFPAQHLSLAAMTLQHAGFAVQRMKAEVEGDPEFAIIDVDCVESARNVLYRVGSAVERRLILLPAGAIPSDEEKARLELPTEKTHYVARPFDLFELIQNVSRFLADVKTERDPDRTSISGIHAS